jgi:hypothetical protein
VVLLVRTVARGGKDERQDLGWYRWEEVWEDRRVENLVGVVV